MFFTLDTDISKLKFEIWPMFFLLSVFSTLEGTFLRFKSDVLQRLHYNSHHIIFSKTFFFTLQEANHGTMSISYDVTSCAKLKCIVSCLNFGIEDNFIDGECLMIDMKHAVNTI